MTTTQLLANPDALTADQLALAFGHLDAKAREARSASARSRAMNLRESIADEASRRGLVIRCNRLDDFSDPRFMCGRPSDFAPMIADHSDAEDLIADIQFANPRG